MNYNSKKIIFMSFYLFYKTKTTKHTKQIFMVFFERKITKTIKQNEITR